MARRNRRPSPDLAADPDKPVIARVMIRVSDVRGRDQQGHQGREFLSPEMQLNAAKALSQVHGWTLDEESSWKLRDLDQSASRKTWQQRPGMAQHVADAEAGRYNVLIFYSLSRFARNVAEGLELWGVFDRASVGLYFTKESIDTATATGRMVRTILLAVAQMQAEQIAEYAEDAHALRASKGKAPARLPHWLKKDGGEIVIVEAKAAVMRRLVELRLDMAGHTTIARTLNQEGHSSPSGAPWSGKVLLEHLKPEALERLAGVATYHLAGGDQRIESAYPVVVEPETIARVIAINERLRTDVPARSWKDYHDAPKARGMSLETKYLVSSLFRCALCGGPMNATGGPKDTPSGRSYICLRGRENPDGHAGGKGTAFAAEPVEDAAARVVRLALLQTASRAPDAPKPKGRGKKAPATPSPPALLPLDEQAGVIRARMLVLLNLLLDEKIDRKVYDQSYAELEVKLNEVLDGGAPAVDDGIDTEATLALARESAEIGEWRAVFIHLIERIEGPVFLDGVETARSDTATSGNQRRCVRVTLRFPVDIDGTSRQIFIAPLYRANFNRARDLFGASGEPLPTA